MARGLLKRLLRKWLRRCRDTPSSSHASTATVTDDPITEKGSQGHKPSVEKCYTRVLEKHGQLNDINVRKRDIETRRKELQTQACQLLRDFRATEEKMNDEIAIYSKAWHLKFSAGICEKLPREIRDMIYDHLMFPHWLFDLDRDFTSDWYKKKTSFPVRAHYLQTDHVGEQMAKELAERIIRTCTFEVKSLSLASWLLRSDLLGHGILPKINIRSLRIHIQTDDRAEDIVTKFPTLEPRQTGYLEKLLNVRRKQGFKLCFLLVAGGKSAVGSMMLSLISFVYRFRKKGFDVSVFRYPKPHPQLSPVPTEDGMETWDWSRTYTWDLTKAFDHEDPVECKKSIETFMKWSEIGVEVKTIEALGIP